MPQGKFKARQAKSGGAVKQKEKHQKQPLGLKKGSLQIAPKKARHLEGAKIQKIVDKSIKNKVEKDMTLRATDSESKSFKVAASVSSTKTTAKKTTGKKK